MGAGNGAYFFTAAEKLFSDILTKGTRWVYQPKRVALRRSRLPGDNHNRLKYARFIFFCE